MGASVFYPSRSMFPKVVGGGGGGGGPNIVSVNFNNDVSAYGPYPFYAFANGQTGLTATLKETPATDVRGFAGSSPIAAPNSSYGALPFSGKNRVIQINTDSNLTGNLINLPNELVLNYFILAFGTDGAGTPNDGFSLQISRAIDPSGNYFGLLGFNVATGVAFAPTFVTLPDFGAHSLAVYFDNAVGKIGYVIDNVDGGYLQSSLGGDMVINPTATCGLVMGFSVDGSGGPETQVDKTVAANLVLQSALIDQALPAGNWYDLGDNLV